MNNITLTGNRMRNKLTATFIFMVFAFAATGLLASGFENTGLGSKARGMGGAFRAIADDWTAAYYNPAGYAFIYDNQLGTNLALINYRNEITPSFYSNDAFGNQYGWGIANGQKIYNFHDVLNKPAAGFVARLPLWGETVIGFSAYQPFDYSIEWRLYSPAASGLQAYNPRADFFAPGHHYKADLDVVAFQITAGREFQEDKLALGIGFQVLRADLVFSDLNFRINPLGGSISDRPRDRIPEFTDNSGRGFGFGLTGGLLWKPTEKMNIAITARLPFDITVDGETRFNYIMPRIERAQPNTETERIFSSGNAIEFSSDFDVQIKLPPSMALGLAYKLTEKLTIALDAEYTLWSRYKGLEFNYSNFNSLPNSQGQLLAKDFFTLDLSRKSEWENAGKIMFGTMYEYSNFLTLLAGFSDDQSPTRSTTEITPQFIDTGDKLSYNFGFVFHINQWDVGLSTNYIDYDDLTVGSLTDINNDGNFDNFPGDYKASTYETILSITHRF